ncbi:Serine/threonine protein kinase [Trema orientale]|uniref:Serine/threonine protein kinase n=1 Tax=Trema orientale TaxID=63057 RepID=A0A2P5CKG1_TREOI|nr:Serine/threonine protein kinase [Trema orientale]
MVGIARINLQRLTFRSKADKEKRTIIIGLKSDNYSREILLRLLTLVVKPEDSVLAIHVQDSDDTFDPNTFHIHEDLCKSKQVDFQVKVCIGDSYISVLTHQVRLSYATILALGSSLSGPNVSALNYCLKALPPTCTLLVLNNVGRILLQRPGTSQQGSRRVHLRQSLSSPSYTRTSQSSVRDRRLRKSLTAPSPSTTAPFLLQQSKRIAGSLCSSDLKKTTPVPNLMAQKLFQRLSILEGEGCSKHFSLTELRWATNNFSPIMLIGEGGQSRVYRAILEDGQTAAVKVLKTTTWAAEDLLREIDLLSRLKHENIVEIIGYCDCGELQAIVYELLRGSLKENLRMLDWSQRMSVAIGVAKALNYLHHSCNPPIIHRDVKSSNILLSDDFQPQLSDFGSAIALRQSHQSSANSKPLSVVGTFGYLAPEYMMYGKIDEKIDVYSYGVVLLELITGKEAIQTDRAVHESLVLWARSMLSYGLCERLIDPYLYDDYNKEEMKLMMVAARLCLMHSSSRRPTMKTILRLFEEPEYWISMQRERDEFLNGISSKCEIDLWKRDDSVTSDMEDN